MSMAPKNAQSDHDRMTGGWSSWELYTSTTFSNAEQLDCVILYKREHFSAVVTKQGDTLRCTTVNWFDYGLFASG